MTIVSSCSEMSVLHHDELSHTHTYMYTHTAKRKPGMSPHMLKCVNLWESQSSLIPVKSYPSPLTSTNGRREEEGGKGLFQPQVISQVRGGRSGAIR